MAKLSVKNLSMKFNEVTAVDNVSFDIEEGDFVTLLGPSGCGKTTILFMLAGIYMPTAGEIYFSHKNVSNIPTEKRNVGLVFQNYALYPHLTVYENIAFPLKMAGMKKKEIQSQIEDVAEMVQITELFKRKPSQLSGGQQQRVAIARAIVKKPEILLLDEPLSNLDARLRIETREEILALQKKAKITTVFVTHDQEEALSVSDRIILMNKGKIVQSGTPYELYYKPEHQFSAEFIGNPLINTFHIQINDGKAFIKELNYPLSGAVNKPCYLCMRAEHIRPALENEPFIEGRIKSSRISGKERIATVAIGDSVISCYLPFESNALTGERIKLSLDIHKAFLFDEKTKTKIEV
jgi:multiple sugar transport system ATP-binding protein